MVKLSSSLSSIQDRGPLLLQAIWIEATIASFFIAARMFARIKVQGRLSLDDYLMLLALLSGFVSGGLATESVSWGFGKHMFYLSQDQISQAIKYQYMAQPFAFLALVFGRVSFAVSLLTIMGTNKLRRRMLYGLIIGQFVINLIFVGLVLGHCVPAEKYWNPGIPGSCVSFQVIEYSGYVQGSWNIFTDLALALLPGVVISNLNMKLNIKIGLVFLMGLGIFNMVAATVTVVETTKIGASGDFTYDYAIVDMWGIVQTYLAIIVASIPFIKPLFRDSKIFSLSFYRSLLGRHSFKGQNWRQRSGFRSPRREGYAMHKDDSTCVSPVPLVPRDDFVIATLPNARIDDYNRNNYLQEALKISPASCP